MRVGAGPFYTGNTTPGKMRIAEKSHEQWFLKEPLLGGPGGPQGPESFPDCIPADPLWGGVRCPAGSCWLDPPGSLPTLRKPLPIRMPRFPAQNCYNRHDSCCLCLHFCNNSHSLLLIQQLQHSRMETTSHPPPVSGVSTWLISKCMLFLAHLGVGDNIDHFPVEKCRLDERQCGLAPGNPLSAGNCPLANDAPQQVM